MSLSSHSPFARPMDGLRIKKGSPPLSRPSREGATLIEKKAERFLQDTWASQVSCLETKSFQLDWVKGKHFLLAGATGSGLGGALATTIFNLLEDVGSLTVLARDPKRSLGYETGLALQRSAERGGYGDRFSWLNSGMDLEGPRLEKIITSLNGIGVDRLIYVNTVAAASSGLLPGCPPIFVKDVDEDGLFQWELAPLDDRSIEATRYMMGTLAVDFPHILEKAGIDVEAVAFTDWRGSLDRSSREPTSPDYGRQGAYSTSLYLPKEIIQAATASAYGSGRVVIDLFLPVMETQALSMIPGGVAMYRLFQKLMGAQCMRPIYIPELALGVLDRLGKAINKEDDNPFPRLDSHEIPLDLWFLEVLKRLNDDESSEFYYKKWISL